MTRLENLSFDEYGKSDLAVEMSVPWTEKHLWLVPQTHHIDRLLKQGVPRGCIWTAAELADLYAIDGLDEDDRRKVALLRAHFNTSIVTVERWSEVDVD